MLRKILILLLTTFLLIITGTTVFAENEIYLSVDTAGTCKLSLLGTSSSSNVDTGLTIGYETFASGNDLPIIAGLGFEYQLPRSASDVSGDYHFNPFFITAKIPFAPNFYAIGRIGYNFLFGDRSYFSYDGGLYWGIGVGCSFNENTDFKLLYSENNGNISGNIYIPNYGSYKYNVDVIYSKINLIIGYKFK